MASEQTTAEICTLVRSYQHPDPCHPWPLAFSADGNFLALGKKVHYGPKPPGNEVLVWDLQCWQKRAEFRGRSEHVEGLAFTPDSKSLCGVGQGSGPSGAEGELQLWDTGTWEATLTIERSADAYYSPMRNVAISPDGKFVVNGMAIGGAGLKLDQWELPAGRYLKDFAHLEDEASSIAYAPDGATVAVSVRRGGKVSVWNVATGKMVWGNKVQSSAVDCLTYSPDSKLLATCGDKNVGLWNARTGARVEILKGHAGETSAVAFSRDGRLLYSGGQNELMIWDVANQRAIHTHSLPGETVRGIGISPDDATLTIVHSKGKSNLDPFGIQQYRLNIPPLPPPSAKSASPKPRPMAPAKPSPHLQAVIDNPDDNAPRLVYAEWLDQQQDPRGEFIRIQIQRSDLESKPQLSAEESQLTNQLLQREQELLGAHFTAWLAPLAELRIRPSQVQFSRGFVSQLELRDVDLTDDSLKYLSSVPELEVLDIVGSSVTDKGLKHLAAVTNLRRIEAGETEITTRQLKQLDGLQRLVIIRNHAGWGNQRIPALEALKEKRNARFLKLPPHEQRARAIEAIGMLANPQGHTKSDYSSISFSQQWTTDADLVFLQAFPELRALDFFECRAITSAGLEHLRPLKKLQKLCLTETSVTDLEPLRELTGLEELVIDSLEKLKRKSFQYLVELPNLTSLTACFCGLGDAVLTHIAECKELRRLDIIENEFSEKGLKKLLKLKKLEKVNIDYMQVHAELVATLLRKQTS